jgi:DNA-binding GntR family transcriptional regulator
MPVARADHDLTAKAYRSLRRMIESAEMVPRRKLSHRSLSRDLKIGRSPVRDALLRLEAEGLVEHRRGSGIYLREISAEELGHIFEVRILNEPHFAAAAAVNATASQRAKLSRICGRMTTVAARSDLARWFAAPENRRRAVELDIDFHRTVLEASGNPVASRMLSSPTILTMSFAWDIFFMQPEWLAEVTERSCAGHRAVERAIHRRDPKAAAAAMREHLVWGRREVPEHYSSRLSSGKPNPRLGGRAASRADVR